MSQPENSKTQKQQFMNMAMAGLAGQVGCLTVIILFAALFGGLWLDRIFETRPLFTILLVIISAPLSLGATFWFAMRAAKRINMPSAREQVESYEEEQKSE